MQWLMLQQDEPEDFVIATGVQYSVRQFVEKAAARAGHDAPLQRRGRTMRRRRESELGDRRPRGRRVVVKIDPRYFRPAEVETLLGDATKARREARMGRRKRRSTSSFGDGRSRLLERQARQPHPAGRTTSAYDYHE